MSDKHGFRYKITRRFLINHLEKIGFKVRQRDESQHGYIIDDNDVNTGAVIYGSGNDMRIYIEWPTSFSGSAHFYMKECSMCFMGEETVCIWGKKSPSIFLMFRKGLSSKKKELTGGM